MLTPKFQLSQNDEDLKVIIFAKFAKISDTELNIEENILTFYSSPYYLRLTLPGNLVDSEKELHSIQYNADEGIFNISCKKETPGIFFNGLEMLTDLLTPKGAEKISRPNIEVLGESKNDNLDDDDDETEWYFDQIIPEDKIEDGYKYGFNNSHTGVFTILKSELCGVVDISDPDNKSAHVRRAERETAEKDKFDEEHYLADYFETDDNKTYLEFKPLFHSITDKEVVYKSNEEELLLKLPRKELLVDGSSQMGIFLGLVDIIFAWCYNHRITLGENCPESAWNIAKLSSTLSWLDSFHSLKEVVSSSIRRSLIFPLVRNWELSRCVLEDTIKIFTLGKKQVLKCLLEVHHQFKGYEGFYILNQLYITDYCIWIQTQKDEKIASLVISLKKINPSKEEIGLDLYELEAAAQIVIEEEENSSKNEEKNNLNNLVNSMDHLSVIENNFALARNDNESDDSILMNGTNRVVNIIGDSSTDSDDSDTTSSSDSSDSSSSSSSDEDDIIEN